MKNILQAKDFRFFIGCPCLIVGHSSSFIDGIDTKTNSVICGGVSYSANLIKPILRKFERLSRNENEQLNKIWAKENIKRTTFESIQLDANIINFLINLNVDVFGWIEQELAIDAEYNNS